MSQVEINDCAVLQYKKADAHLNRVYQKAMQYMKGDQKGISTLKQVERAWISYRDLQCKAAVQDYEGGSIESAIKLDCLTTLTEHRIAEMKSIYENDGRKLD